MIRVSGNGNSATYTIFIKSFDSSLDNTGTDYLLELLNSFEDTANIFVISHKGDVLLDKFDNNIKFVKRNDFSVIEQN